MSKRKIRRRQEKLRKTRARAARRRLVAMFGPRLAAELEATFHAETDGMTREQMQEFLNTIQGLATGATE